TPDERAARERQATDRLRVAMVHICLRESGPGPRRTLPDSPDVDAMSPADFQHRMVRHISTWIGQPERCPFAECRRSKLCEHDPPDGWRDAPPPTHQEHELARLLMHYHLTQEVEARRAAEGASIAR